jgi:predicted SnoaL-like aldol condensation-catalyzing enzyme
MKTIAIRCLATLLAAIAFSTSAGGGEPTDSAKRELNKKTVAAYYAAITRNDFAEAKKYLGDLYIEHDPEREDGVEGLRKALDYNDRHGSSAKILHSIVVAEGDYVVMYSESVPVMARPPGMPSSGQAPAPVPAAATAEREPDLTGDIFRLQSGKIVEHWNAIYKP